MTTPPACPRCLGALCPPDLWNDQWRCEEHGEVAPYRVAASSREQALLFLAHAATAPVWVPWPMPVHWFGSGVAWAGDERTGPRATAFAAGGPSPLGGPAELVLVAEEPGTGLGARLAGLPGTDPERIGGKPEEKIEAAGHPTALWPVLCPPDRAVFVGEACGVWLWVALWPSDAATLLLEHLVLWDLRSTETLATCLLFGADSTHL
ncbi:MULTISPECIES: DUF6758 family protein [unclassified Frankia]|uniref:DUF6758 family protein n=1 Tax=unclassified Frankia TaxID=2632575 RepID=UPI002024EE09